MSPSIVLSYIRLFSLSPSTSYALLISMNLDCAAASSLFRSGCVSSERRLYAFLISLSLAEGSTPSTE